MLSAVHGHRMLEGWQHVGRVTWKSNQPAAAAACVTLLNAWDLRRRCSCQDCSAAWGSVHSVIDQQHRAGMLLW